MQWLTNLLVNRGNDLSTFFLPNAYFFKRAILKFGQIPLFSPIQFLGFPYLADPQNYIFYLPNYLFVIFPVELAFIVLLLGHLLLAGFTSFLLFKNTFKLKSFPSIFSAIIYAITPMIFSHLEAGHYSMIVAFAWLPLFIHLVFSFLKNPTIKTIIFLSIVSWILYLNYISITYFALIFFATYSIFYLFTNKEKINLKLFAIRYLLFALFFLGLIAPVLLSQLQVATHTTRDLLTFADVAQPIWNLKLFGQNLFFPYNLTHVQFSTERVLFPGLVIWLLAAFGWFKVKRSDKRFLTGWLILSLVVVLGASTPIFKLMYSYFPLMRWMRVTTRMWIISLLVFIVPFAGLGLQKLLLKKTKRWAIFLAAIALFELLLVNFRIFSRPIEKNPLPASFYQTIIQDGETNFRVYCTTGCFSLQKLGELGINSLTGNNPVQLKTSTQKIADAAGYKYADYIPILPPYPVFASRPQPSSLKLADLATKYIASPYELTDPGFKLLTRQDGFFLYLNQQQLKFPQAFNYSLKSLKIELAVFGLTWVAIVYAYRHPQLFYRRSRARR